MSKILRNESSLPATGEEFSPPEVLRRRQLEMQFLEWNEPEEEATPEVQEESPWASRPLSVVGETTEQRLIRELESLKPETVGRLLSAVMRKHNSDKIEVQISGCRLVLQVFGVSFGSSGMAFLVPKDTAFEPDMGVEFAITHRGRRYNVISTKQFYPFPGLDFNVASFMFVDEGTPDD